ncbi:2,3-diaminopropionate biosynthesis protein SbnB [Amycolatopsis sp. PS_44_ISF1]|uniref:2,3-diaminopropionate biosynthesis protein SbnB n=1 Tax=Amycolatopsis sp. PS_44_ISF1 TaxID=2974917 RepID=UPI0028DFC36F|nr:2,3-diaminopropionate biosynthesis protein SbnB [Amycolatopsis sp. PS_44_ISF1]MDT8912930.1 2,3-diaminopropionate biosynthesis protein SbnB [Amycolatopsis sp. PS_44_ISF1]
MLILGAHDVRRVLDGADAAVLDTVRRAYSLHARGRTAVPHSVFLNFPDDRRNRIIGLPAYLDDEAPVAGVKWISSFPGNIGNGLDRASAAMVLNSMTTGHPEALVEASTISARRTAASAAVAASTLTGTTPDTGVSLVGCGVINFEVLRFLLAALPAIDSVTLFDLDEARAAAFAARATVSWPRLKVAVATRIQDGLGAHTLVSFATTATVPYLTGEHLRPGTLVLHLSLRDFLPTVVLSAVNVVDDADHVCRASTSLHLAEQETGDRRFVTAALGDLLVPGARSPRREDLLTLFSPFGLGVLDLALADFVRREAVRRQLGVQVPFLPSEMPPEPRS